MCTGCGICIEECPVKAIALTDDGQASINDDFCIRCGRCIDACPLGLMPSLLAQLGQRHRAEEALQLNVLACVECGSCSYVCPSNIPLVQYIRSGKAQAQKIARKK